MHVFPHALLVPRRIAHEERSGLPVERVGGVGVKQELGEENVEDVHEVEHRAPGLVDHVQADAARRLVHSS